MALRLLTLDLEKVVATHVAIIIITTIIIIINWDWWEHHPPHLPTPPEEAAPPGAPPLPTSHREQRATSLKPDHVYHMCSHHMFFLQDS